MNWTFERDRPIYTQIIERIERAIATGEYPPGSKLPGVRELAATAGVNPNTMQRALAELETMGLVNAQRTSGRFVTGETQRIQGLKQQRAVKIAKQFIQSMQELGCTNQEMEAALQQAKEGV